ncbi:methyl-accepting chemotaxis protein [Halomicroarcula sp. GCM10025817]|uniref:methyl-accepting chemotaxis protein n=1 Tax=Haloarcula TaxID=2237 RepID=UPI0023E88281|nr:methyl-accepting chemotaxis protein [Halomicroarcula sp. SYNS111]
MTIQNSGTKRAPDGSATDERTVANAQGALEVVQVAANDVDDQLAAIDDRASAQASDAQWVVEEMSALSATIEEIAATTAEVSEQSDRAAAEASEGRAAARGAIETMDEVREVGEAVLSEVDALRDRIDRIAAALGGIDRIADQTNMLALNASIEAARAGGESDGFAVVADEIKQLAEESQAQADDIDTALSAVRTATEDTVEQLEAAVAAIDDGADQVETAMTSLDSLADTVAETADGVTSVSDATDEQASTSEAVAERCETLAQRATAIEGDLSRIRSARTEQTAMFGEIDDVLAAADADRRDRLADADRRDRLADAPTLGTGIDGLDDLCGGGLVVGGQAVVRYTESAPVDAFLAQVCANAVATGRAVSLTPTPTLERETLAAAFDAADVGLDRALATDRLFVLDAFDAWDHGRNVFDLGRTSLSAANETTAERRDAPLLVVGNVAGEVATVGEQAAREARYENDDGVFEPADTVLNVVADGEVPETLAVFYAGAADQDLLLGTNEEGPYVAVRASPSGRPGVERPVTVRQRPPFLRVGPH